MPRQTRRRSASSLDASLLGCLIFPLLVVALFALIFGIFFLNFLAHNPLIAIALALLVLAGGGGYWFYWQQQQARKALVVRQYQQQLQAQQHAYQQYQQQEATRQRYIADQQRAYQQQLDQQRQQEAVRLVEQREQLARQQRLEAEQRALQSRQEQERKRLRDAKLSNGLLHLSARDFELTIGSLLQAYGYTDVQHTGKAGDNGADLHARSPSGERVIVQCKRYAPGQTVSTSTIRDLIGALQIHHADRGIFVTPSALSKNAQALASQHNIDVFDGSKLNTMLAQVKGTTQTF